MAGMRAMHYYGLGLETNHQVTHRAQRLRKPGGGRPLRERQGIDLHGSASGESIGTSDLEAR